jgi:hypothetical protein
MQDKSCGNDGPDGEDCAPPPIGKNAERNYHQACGNSDFGKDRSRHLIALSWQSGTFLAEVANTRSTAIRKGSVAFRQLIPNGPVVAQKP